MAYNAVSQAELEVASNATDSDDSRPSSPHRKNRRSGSFHQLPLDSDHMGGSQYLEPAKSAEDAGIGRLGSMIRSMTSTSYDMVEDDDYDAADHPPATRRSESLRRMPLPLDTTAPSHPDSPRLRSPIADEPIPLSHPTPDLQSLQGAYLNNVERLERSAERISSADIGTEIRKMDRQQKRRSVSSLPSPIGAASVDAGAYPSAHVPSPHNSIMSASRLAQVSEHRPEEPHHPPIHHPPIEPIPPPPQMPPPAQLDTSYHEEYHYVMEEDLPRPASAASGDTYQQARVLFNDFDGVHYVHHDQGALGRQMSLTRPPLASRADHYKEPQVGENMVYYPAPVPMMLNLPPKLSQKSNAEREKRRTQIMDAVPAESRKSAPWLAGQVPEHEDHRGEKPSKEFPPQLRASVFFEHPAAPIDIEVKQASAVATLDSILDASTHAPVTAFTDHPYAGHLGAEVYGRSKQKAPAKKPDSMRTVSLDHRDGSSHRLEDPTEAEAADIHEGTSLHDSRREAGSDGVPREAGEEEGEEELAYTGPPTTLLAELELRKHELNQRQRTAATSVGLHSTLLQLDAVAQKQSEHRRKRPVTLAWENPDAHKNEDDADEDVPLGVLFPEKNVTGEEVRPLGLMEKREMEESEPLSRRRARLRGEAPPPPRTPDKRPMTMYSRYGPEPSTETPQPESEDEGETLAQRLKRMKAKDRTSTVAESEFATEILAELEHVGDEKAKEEDGAPEEETLAQRRARLQNESTEAKRNSTAKIPRYRRSMADILHARRPSTAALQPTHPNEAPVPAPVPRGLIHSHSYDARLSAYQLPIQARPQSGMGFPPSSGHMRNESAAYGMAHPNTFYSDAILGMNPLSYAAPPGYHAKTMRPGVEPPQREMIDRWRQSIV